MQCSRSCKIWLNIFSSSLSSTLITVLRTCSLSFSLIKPFASCALSLCVLSLSSHDQSLFDGCYDLQSSCFLSQVLFENEMHFFLRLCILVLASSGKSKAIAKYLLLVRSLKDYYMTRCLNFS